MKIMKTRKAERSRRGMREDDLKPGVLILPKPEPEPEPGDDDEQNYLAAIRYHLAEDNPPLSLEPRAEEVDGAVRTLEQMFPNICPKAAISFLKLHPPERALQLAADHFLQNGFPESNSGAAGASTSNAAAERAGNGRKIGGHNERKEVVDLSSSSSDSDCAEQSAEEIQEAQFYQEWCYFRLSADFPRVGLPSLRTALRLFRGKLGPTYKAVNLQYQRATTKKGGGGAELVDKGVSEEQGPVDTSWLPKGKLKLLKCDRPPKDAPAIECPRFEKDWKALQSEFRKLKGLDEVYYDTGEALQSAEVLVECGCCFAENPFEELVQCADGHLFCTECLRRHLEGYIFGFSQTCGLPSCMDTNGCDKNFPWSEVIRALPLDVLSKYEQRQAEDAVARANLEGLVYCPFCNHPWEVDRGMVVLFCRNETCNKASCIKCRKPNHHPQRCEEVEMKSETSLRRKVEELMTKALVRECTSCRAELVKTDGCNKITCRCGQTMCYVCRRPISDYSHYCQHAREPGSPCKLCAGCSLWERENETEVVKAAKQAAIQEVGAQHPGLLKRDIGPSEANKDHKKPRLPVVVPFLHH